MAEFAAFPPEINSGLMYAGPGAGPMIAAGAAWDALADELYLAAAAYGSVVSDLASSWLGPSSVSMAAAAATYVSWISATAVQAQETAAQAMAAVAAYEAAFVMTVPPPVIAANRALLLALVATNFFGQNTPAIMATEALYVEMWAQDAAAMYGYAGASSAASALTPFTTPLPTTNPSGISRVGHCGDTSCRHLGRHGRADGVTVELRGSARCPAGTRVNDVLLVVDIAAVVPDNLDVIDCGDIGDERGLRRCLVRIDVYLGRLAARLGWPADECLWPGDWHICSELPDVRIGDEHRRRFGSRCVELTRHRRHRSDRDRGPGGLARSVVGAPGLDLCCAGIQPRRLRVAGRRAARCAAGRAGQSDKPDGRSAGEFSSSGEALVLPCAPATTSVPPWCSARYTPVEGLGKLAMIPRYQWFIQRLNNIRKVCRLHNMTMVSLDLMRGLASTLAWRREVAQAFHRSMAWNFGPAGLPT